MAFDASQDQKDRQRETSYSGNPRSGYGSGGAGLPPWGLFPAPGGGIQDILRGVFPGAGGQPAPPQAQPQHPPFPFMFGIPPSQMTPNFMPQIAPPNMGNPMNLEQLYGVYGVGANQPMQQMPNVPPVMRNPVEQQRHVTALPFGAGGM